VGQNSLALLTMTSVPEAFRERMISNFAIYPVNKFAWVNIEPNSKIVRSTKEEIAQGSNDVVIA
jgi:hypothetical protein